jgi:hypothetical protein
MVLRDTTRSRIVASAVAIAVLPVAAHAQDDSETAAVRASAAASDESSAAELSKKLSNPISSLISVPFQFNYDFGLGPDGDGVKSTLNIQPVVPVSIGKDWNMIVRTILPVVTQFDVSARGSNQFGLGDTTQSFFFSPKNPGPSGIIWGAGPAILYPTATDQLLGGDKWGLGPTFVVLKQSGKNTFGMLANHIWSVAGNDQRDNISSTFIQPFFAHNTPNGMTYSINSETTYNWETDQWTVPVNVLVAKTTTVGKQPVQVGVGGRYYFEKPEGGPDWGIRFVLTMLFPG